MFAFLTGSIVSFVDVLTDILTLVEFYREDHKTWFCVGLVFLILPCFAFSLLYSMSKLKELATSSYKECCTKVLLCGFNPFSVAFARLRAFIFCLRNFKTLWKGQNIRETFTEDTDEEQNIDELLYHSTFALLFEAVVESSPQFILQLYAISVQQHPVEIIQMISLPVSFLSLTWASTTADELLQKGETIHVLTMKHKMFLFFTHLISMSSRLFAVCYFVVSYKWWVTVVLTLHSLAVALFEAIWVSHGRCIGDKGTLVFAVLFFFLHWLRDDWSVKIQDDDNENKRKKTKRMQLFCNVLFVVENTAMILFFYFSPVSNTWYSLPVTVCVCSFSVLGAVMRVAHFSLLMKETNGFTVNPMLERNANVSTTSQ